MKWREKFLVIFREKRWEISKFVIKNKTNQWRRPISVPQLFVLRRWQKGPPRRERRASSSLSPMWQRKRSAEKRQLTRIAGGSVFWSIRICKWHLEVAEGSQRDLASPGNALETLRDRWGIVYLACADEMDGFQERIWRLRMEGGEWMAREGKGWLNGLDSAAIPFCIMFPGKVHNFKINCELKKSMENTEKQMRALKLPFRFWRPLHG